MNNEKIQKIFNELKRQNQVLQDNLNNVISTVSENLKQIHITQHQIMLNVDALNLLLRNKDIISKEELDKEIERIAIELKEKMDILQKKKEEININIEQIIQIKKED